MSERETGNAASAGDVLTALARLQVEIANTWVQPLVDDLVAALAADTTVVELRQEIEFLKAEKARMEERIDNFTRAAWSLRNRAEVAERGHKACLARESDRGTMTREPLPKRTSAAPLADGTDRVQGATKPPRKRTWADPSGDGSMRLRELEGLRELLEAHLMPEAGPHSMEVPVATGLRAVEIAEGALRDNR